MKTIARSLLLRLLAPAPLDGWLSHLTLAIPRIVGGYLLAVNFGGSKFGMPWTDPDQHLQLFQVAAWFPGDVAKFGLPFSLAPTFFAWMGAASEAIGGVLLMLGFQTRIAGSLLCCTMLTAIFFQKWGGDIWEMLPAMGFLWISIYSVVLGSGKLGLDSLLYHYMHREKTV